MKCLPGKHVWVTATAFNGAQYKRCSICGATKK